MIKKKILKIGSFILSAVIAAASMFALSGCAIGKNSLPEVNLSIWSDERNHEIMLGMVEEFKKNHENEARFNITISEESELTCKETVLKNPQAAADIYTFADDQFEELWRAGALLNITEDTEKIIADNGGSESGAIRSSTRDGKLYAYPETSGNGYFLYYNSAYFTEEDVKDLDRILEVAAANNKKFCMDFSSGWYIYSFFKSAGLELGCNDDGVTNYCNWNATDTKYKGIDVAESMLKIASHDGFLSCPDDDFILGVNDGTIIAGINGAWNAASIEQAYGKNYAAAKLPHYTVAGDSVQMCSFAGYKLMGVNAYTKEAHWAMMLAQWLTNEQNQLARFREVGECPSNINVAHSDEVQSAPAVAALLEQSQFGYTQSVADTFWDPSCIFGTTLEARNVDGKDLQTLLDNLVAGITAKPSVKKE